MRKKTVKYRLQLLNASRENYLNFLRNLTPQIALLTVSLLLGSMLDFTRVDWSNWLPTFACFVLFSAFLLAFYINADIFYEHLFSPLKAWRTRLEKLLKTRNFHGYRYIFVKLKIIWKFRFIEFLEILVVFHFFMLALVIVSLMSISSMLSILRNIYTG